MKSGLAKGTPHTILYAALWTAVVALFLTLRLVHQSYMLTSPPGNILIIDSLYYYQWAEKIAGGHGLGPTVFFMSPLYPIFIAFAIQLSSSGVAATFLLQIILSLGTLGLIGNFTARRFGPAAGVLAGLIYAIYAPSIYYDSVILSSTLILFLTMAAITCLDIAEQKGQRFPVILAGIAIGLSALARPNALILLVVFGFVLVKRWKKYGIEQAAVLVITTLLVIFPAGLRNYLHGGEWYLTTNSAGVNFHIGNNEDSNGLYTEAPFLSSAEPTFEAAEYRSVAQLRTGKTLTLTQASRYWMGQGLSWILSNPVEWLLLEGKKLVYFLNRVESPNNVSFYGIREYSGVVRKLGFLNFGLIAPLGLIGLVIARKEAGWHLSAALVIGYLAASLIFFVAGEYRYPIIGVIIAYGAGSLVRIFSRLRHKEIEQAQIAMIGILVLLMICNIPWKTMRTLTSPRMDYFNWASVSFANRDLINASLLFTASLSWDPTWQEAHVQLAQVYDEMELTELADKEYSAAGITREELNVARKREQVENLIPDSLGIDGDLENISTERLAILGSHFLRLEKFHQAALVFESVVERDSTDLDILFQYAFSLEAVGNRRKALHLYYSIEQKKPDDPLIPYRIAWTQFGMNEIKSAQSTLVRVDNKGAELPDKESRDYWKRVVERTRNTFLNY